MISVNLIPRNVRLAQALRRRIWRWASLAMVGLLLLGASAGSDFARRGTADDLSATNTDLQVQITRAQTNLRTIAAELMSARNHLENATALRTKRAWSGMIALIARSMPENCWLTSIATHPDKPVSIRRVSKRTASKKERGTEAEIVVIDAPRRLKIVGYAERASEPNEFVDRLNHTGVFRLVELERSQREPILDGSYYRFQLNCEW